VPQSRVRVALYRTPAQPSDSWAGWDHIAHNGVVDSKKREKRKEGRDRDVVDVVESKDRCNREIQAYCINAAIFIAHVRVLHLAT